MSTIEPKQRVDTWVTIFPWIEYLGARELIALQRLGGPAEWWAKESPAHTSARRPSMREVFDLLASIVLSSRSILHEDCGTLFPSLQNTILVEDVPAEPGIISALAELGILTLGDVRDKSIRDLSAMMHLSRGEVASLLGQVMQAIALPNDAAYGAAVAEWFGDLDVREKSILVWHHCAAEPLDLNALAARHRTPLERMQELSRALPSRLSEGMQASPALRAAVEEFDRTTDRPVLRVHIQEHRPWLTNLLADTEVTVLQLFSFLRHAIMQEEWLCRGDLPQQVKTTLDILDLEEGEVMSISVARRMLTLHGWVAAHVAAWLTYCGLSSGEGQLQRTAIGAAILKGQAPEPQHVTGGSDLRVFGVRDGTFTAAPLASSSSDRGLPSTDGLAIRTWARLHGHAIGDRGRIPRLVQEAYDEAQRGTSASETENRDGALPAAGGEPPLQPLHYLIADFEALASLLLPEGSGATFGSLLRYEEDLPTEVQQVVQRILNTTLGDRGWIRDPHAVPTTSELPRSRATLKHRARAILQEVDHPLTTAGLVLRMGEAVNERSLKVQLAADLDFMRSDIDSWALSDWKLRPYTSVRELVGEEVDKAGGSVESDHLIHVLTEAFTIKESTIRQVMSSPPFTARGGKVRRLDDLVEDKKGETGEIGDETVGEAIGVQLARDLGLDF